MKHALKKDLIYSMCGKLAFSVEHSIHLLQALLFANPSMLLHC